MRTENDMSTSVSALKAAIREFVDERDWGRYHDPKNLAMSIGIEAGELMECYQWVNTERSDSDAKQPNDSICARAELADVIIYSLLLAMRLDIDVVATVLDKIAANEVKYPKSTSRGIYRRPTQSHLEG